MEKIAVQPDLIPFFLNLGGVVDFIQIHALLPPICGSSFVVRGSWFVVRRSKRPKAIAGGHFRLMLVSIKKPSPPIRTKVYFRGTTYVPLRAT
jgi:hypothetical protein